jgi:hypothetical protein
VIFWKLDFFSVNMQFRQRHTHSTALSSSMMSLVLAWRLIYPIMSYLFDRGILLALSPYIDHAHISILSTIPTLPNGFSSGIWVIGQVFTVNTRNRGGNFVHSEQNRVFFGGIRVQFHQRAFGGRIKSVSFYQNSTNST